MAKHRLRKRKSVTPRNTVAVASVAALAGGAVPAVAYISPRTDELPAVFALPDTTHDLYTVKLPRLEEPVTTVIPVVGVATTSEPAKPSVARTPVKAAVEPAEAPVKPVASKTSPVVEKPSESLSDPSLVEAARKYLGRGIQYVWGGKSLSVGFDCSGFVWQVLKDAGYRVPYRVSGALKSWTTPVSASNAKPGDLVFWSSGGTVYHVEIYIGGGKSLGAANPQIDIGIHAVHGSPTYGRIPS